MVGLSIVLESHPESSSNTTTSCGVSNNTTVFDNKIPQVINKTNMIISSNPFLAPSYTTNSLTSSSSSSSSSSTSFLPFLEHCFLCGQKLLPGKDIYMYKGDRGFCSVECRYRQIFMDEEDCYRKENCSFSAIKPTPNNSETSSNPRRQRKSTKR